jgi:archaeal cell division control protein 6
VHAGTCSGSPEGSETLPEGSAGTMDIGEYLERQSRRLARSTGRIRDFRVFDFNYIPQRPLMRPEAGPIIDACLRSLTTGIPNHLLVFGGRGCGKTLLVRYIGRLLAQKHGADVLYANCRQHNTSFKILAHLLGVRPRGLGIDELWNRFCDAHRERIILVLDEVDLLSDKDRNKDLLYLAGRSASNPMVILLTNHPKFLSRLDESIRSSLQPQPVHLRNYNAQELRRILQDRARAGLDAAPEELLGRIAAMTARLTNSDARVAIKTLYYTALEPGADPAGLFNRARRDLVRDLLADLNDRALLMLRAAAATTEPLVRAVYDGYRRLSAQHHEEPFSYPYFYSNLSYLQSMGLILLASSKQGRTYTNRVQCLFEPELLDALWAARFG